MIKHIRMIISPVAGAILVLAGLLYFLSPPKGDEDIQNLTFSTGQLKFVMGSGEMNAERLMINGFRDGYAVLSSGPVGLNAQKHHVLYMDLNTGEPGLGDELAPAFFWRQKGHSEQVSKLTLDGSNMIDLANVKGWNGEIIEIGFLFQETGGRTAQLGEVSLRGSSLQSNIRLTRDDWYQFEPWTQRSVNFLNGGAPGQAIYLPVVLLTWVIVSLLVFFLSGTKNLRELVVYGFSMVLVAWILLDIRWTINGAKQTRESISTRWKLSDQERLQTGPDAELYTLISQFKAKIPGESLHRIVIVGDPSAFSYYLMRAKYHLLPEGALVRNRLSSNIAPGNVDYVIFIDDFASKRSRWNDIWLQLPMDDAWRNSLELVDSGPLGVLFSVGSD